MVLRNMQEARGLVERRLAELPISPPTELAILDEHTMETDFGWVFFWNSRKYQETGEFLYALAGNTPLIVRARSKKSSSNIDKHTLLLRKACAAVAILHVTNYRCRPLV